MLKKKQLKIVLLGPQGSGKGTQAGLISEHYSLPHISTGDIFRDHISKNTELGIKIKKIINQGLLVPDEITNEIIRQRLSRQDCKNGFILDGFPRNLNQAKSLDSFDKVTHALNIVISDDEAVRRISSRLTCRNCGAVYSKSDSLDKCPKCGGELYTRDDDSPEAVKKRLSIYHKETEPIIEFYKEKSILFTVNGERPVKEIFDDIRHILDS